MPKYIYSVSLLGVPFSLCLNLKGNTKAWGGKDGFFMRNLGWFAVSRCLSSSVIVKTALQLDQSVA